MYCTALHQFDQHLVLAVSVWSHWTSSRNRVSKLTASVYLVCLRNTLLWHGHHLRNSIQWCVRCWTNKRGQGVLRILLQHWFANDKCLLLPRIPTASGASSFRKKHHARWSSLPPWPWQIFQRQPFFGGQFLNFAGIIGETLPGETSHQLRLQMSRTLAPGWTKKNSCMVDSFCGALDPYGALDPCPGLFREPSLLWISAFCILRECNWNPNDRDPRDPKHQGPMTAAASKKEWRCGA